MRVTGDVLVDDLALFSVIHFHVSDVNIGALRAARADRVCEHLRLVRYGFIKIRMKVVNFIKTTFIKNRFHQKPLSSKTTLQT